MRFFWESKQTNKKNHQTHTVDFFSPQEIVHPSEYYTCPQRLSHQQLEKGACNNLTCKMARAARAISRIQPASAVRRARAPSDLFIAGPSTIRRKLCWAQFLPTCYSEVVCSNADAYRRSSYLCVLCQMWVCITVFHRYPKYLGIQLLVGTGCPSLLSVFFFLCGHRSQK